MSTRRTREPAIFQRLRVIPHGHGRIHGSGRNLTHSHACSRAHSGTCGRGHGRGRSAGGSLVEVLVAVLLLSFGMLAMGAMQTYAVASSKMASHRAMAALLAAELADVLRANADGLDAGYYDLRGYLTDAPSTGPESVAAASCAFPQCSVAGLAAYDLARLKARVRAELPQGGLQIARSAGGHGAELWVVWAEPKVFAHDRPGADSDSSPEKDFDNCPAEARALKPVPRCVYMRVVL